ncbi:hypothetical protein GCM10025868_44330 [Angustibacter aerolatus]|uniref:Uncharacterized protein n=1 Tax=Angustibacter aerolatus TaxID=1162965 RepID=A0ABQ6JMD5_9ACTN|nr:hypothetical protein GCM10025868_44330 [Angustibacter aerolatus]
MSSTGVESVRDGAVPEGLDDGFLVYLRAKAGRRGRPAGTDGARLAGAATGPAHRRARHRPGAPGPERAARRRLARRRGGRAGRACCTGQGPTARCSSLVGGEVPVAQAVEGVGADPDRP